MEAGRPLRNILEMCWQDCAGIKFVERCLEFVLLPAVADERSVSVLDSMSIDDHGRLRFEHQEVLGQHRFGDRYFSLIVVTKCWRLTE